MSRTVQIAVLGTGLMGEPIAQNLARAGFDVRVWNRTPAKAQALAADGCTPCATPREAAERAEAVLTMLAHAEAAEGAILGEDGAAASLEPGALWIQMSTVGIAGGERLADLARERGLVYIDAPVMGSRGSAQQRALTVLGAGPVSARERCAPVFEAIAARTLWLDDKPGAGTRMKLVMLSWIFPLMEMMAEIISFSEVLGLDPKAALALIDGGPVPVPFQKARMMLEGQYPASHSLNLAGKDMRLVLDAAESAGLPMPVSRATTEQFSRAIDLGHGEADVSACFFACHPHPRAA
jgi:3-hydroxyisobutyrate dehydrogenase